MDKNNILEIGLGVGIGVIQTLKAYQKSSLQAEVHFYTTEMT